MTSIRPRSRELAERASNGTQVRLLWRQGTRQLWVEVREPDRDRALAIPVQPERALDAFHHPYAYVGLHGIPVAPESLAICGADRRQHTQSAVSSDALGATVAQIEHIALATNDVECLRVFYKLFGAMASPPSTDPHTGARSCVLDFCGVRLELFDRQGAREGTAGDERLPGLIHLGFALGSADAVDELSRAIAAAGHRVLEPPHRSRALGRYESVVVDPDGNRLKLTV